MGTGCARAFLCSMVNRPTLVLIHGFPQDHTLWKRQVPALTPFAKVIAPDLMGFGQHVDLPQVMTMEAYAEKVHGMLEQQGEDRVVLCGLSMGGYVAMAFAERWPERLSGLILSNTRSTADDEEGRAARLATAHRALQEGTAVIARGMVPKLLSERTRKQQPELAREVEAMMAAQPANAVAAASLGMAQRADRTHVLRRSRIPSLIITGSDDTLMPLPTSRSMHAALSGSQLEVIEGAAHLTNIEDPERFNELIVRFLTSGPLAHA